MSTLSSGPTVGQMRAAARIPEHQKRAVVAEFFARTAYLRLAMHHGPTDRRTLNAFAEWDRAKRVLTEGGAS